MDDLLARLRSAAELATHLLNEIAVELEGTAADLIICAVDYMEAIEQNPDGIANSVAATAFDIAYAAEEYIDDKTKLREVRRSLQDVLVLAIARNHNLWIKEERTKAFAEAFSRLTWWPNLTAMSRVGNCLKKIVSDLGLPTPRPRDNKRKGRRRPGKTTPFLNSISEESMESMDSGATASSSAAASPNLGAAAAKSPDEEVQSNCSNGSSALLRPHGDAMSAWLDVCDEGGGSNVAAPTAPAALAAVEHPMVMGWCCAHCERWACDGMYDGSGIFYCPACWEEFLHSPWYAGSSASSTGQ